MTDPRDDNAHRGLGIGMIAAGMAGLGLALGLGLCPAHGAEGLRVIDGDTVAIRTPPPRGQAVEPVRVRILGLDAPETRGAGCEAERKLGRAASRTLRRLAAEAGTVTIEATGRDRYGRTLAHLTLDGRDVAGALISAGLARPYAGGRREGWCR